ncbi:MAG: hypothetical protein BWY83_03301 [bacterium ADurb.Bin478]|nr:MAG: hypothetical protein BWY83_03301 [bacterium ADurb.Bin478]
MRLGLIEFIPFFIDPHQIVTALARGAKSIFSLGQIIGADDKSALPFYDHHAVAVKTNRLRNRRRCLTAAMVQQQAGTS